MTVDQVLRLVRPALLAIQPYSSARDEFDSTSMQGNDWVFLDANENPNPSAYNRYPDPHQRKLKEMLAKIKGVSPESIFLGNGSDEAIDLVIRLFCTPAYHSIIIPSPTYGMYSVSAAVNEAPVKVIPMTKDFDIDVSAILKLADDKTRVLFLCSPNNPTGNLLSARAVEQVLAEFKGIVVVDEAYIDFSDSKSLATRIVEHPNLIVLQTLSKAWGLAGLRLGMAIAHPEIIAMLNKIKPPYNISSNTQEVALSRLADKAAMRRAVSDVLRERGRVALALSRMPQVQHVYPSDANFLLVKIKSAAASYEKLVRQHIVVRDRSRVLLCDDCLRITIGTQTENDRLLSAISTL